MGEAERGSEGKGGWVCFVIGWNRGGYARQPIKNSNREVGTAKREKTKPLLKESIPPVRTIRLIET